MIKTKNCVLLGLTLFVALAPKNQIVLANITDSRVIRPDILNQTAIFEFSEGESKTWCSQAGGTWFGKSCQWQDFLEEERELSLDRQCSDRNGIWQTVYEEVIGPSFCGNGFCTSDAVVIDYVEKGVGCVWEDNSRG
jgi:hypothetical protein